MALLYFVVDLFIDTFGITRPSARGRRRAAFFILGLLILVVLAMAGAALLIHSVSR